MLIGYTLLPPLTRYEPAISVPSHDNVGREHYRSLDNTVCTQKVEKQGKVRVDAARYGMCQSVKGQCNM